eukprot:3840395-Lingulodinium_polyedra.AAC.1
MKEQGQQIFQVKVMIWGEGEDGEAKAADFTIGLGKKYIEGEIGSTDELKRVREAELQKLGLPFTKRGI